MKSEMLHYFVVFVFIYVHVCVVVCIWTCACVCPQKLEEDVRCASTGISGSWKLMGAENQIRSSENAASALMAE